MAGELEAQGLGTFGMVGEPLRDALASGRGSSSPLRVDSLSASWVSLTRLIFFLTKPINYGI